MPSCAWIAEHRQGIDATAAFVAKKAAGIALSAVVSAAQDYRDSGRKADFIDGLAAGFRSHDWSGDIDAGEVLALVDAWTPAKPHWTEAARRFEELWTAHQPRTKREAELLAESVAQGLNSAAYCARLEAELAVMAKTGIK